MSPAAGPAVGGRTGDGNDDATSLLTSEHVFRVPGGAPSLDLDTAFSFNVVTNTAGGTVVDFAPAEVRTQQGTLRQFLLNAAAISGPNTMRFVPAVPTDAGGGGLTWWRSSVTEQLPTLVDASTAVDGQAYSFADPTAQVDPSARLGRTGGHGRYGGRARRCGGYTRVRTLGRPHARPEHGRVCVARVLDRGPSFLADRFRRRRHRRRRGRRYDRGLHDRRKRSQLRRWRAQATQGQVSASQMR